MTPPKTNPKLRDRQMIEDAFGLAALVVILLGGLHLPGLF